MKNNYSFLLFIILFTFNYVASYSDELKINSSKMKLDKKTETLILEENIKVTDNKNNQLFAEFAKYKKDEGLLETLGKTKIITSEGFEIYGENILFDDKKKLISSDFTTKIIDRNDNKISVEMFNYLINKNIFFSKGKIKIEDSNKNNYNFSEIYIDEKKNTIVGSDVKAFLNQESIKISEENQPRIFANTISITEGESELEKGVFTYCKNRGKDKCPPWTLQSKKIKHSTTKKTIYYEDAVIKIYDFPIFYFPRFSHPDPTVKRRSGFLVPSLANSTTTGSGITIPYFFAISNSKDFTFTPRLYAKEKPLFLGEYRQDFKNSFLIVDAGYTKGYEKTSDKKTPGGRSHFFSRFNLDFMNTENKKSKMELNIQKVSNDTYLKIHDINTTLVEGNKNILENTLSYDLQYDDLFFGATVSAFENLSIEDNSRYEYLFPYLTFDKNILLSEKYGVFDLSSNLRVRNYEVDKQTEFFVNDINWKSNKWINKFGLENQFKGIIKSVNYNAENTEKFKNNKNNSELFGAIGYLTKLGLYKNDLNKKNSNLLQPKLLLRYAPGHMRKTESGRLKYSNLFEINKINEIDVIENGLSASLGFDYKRSLLNDDGSTSEEKFTFSAGQVISESENSDIASSTSLDQRFSDLVGEAKLNLKNNLDLNYNFALDQNYKEFNYNEIGADLSVNKTKFNISYLEETNHIGKQEYIKTGINIDINDSGKLSFSTKRNLLSSSAEFYNLSYEYINDCLKAGIVYRREFYTDRDLESENSLMFKISLIPFAELNSPTFGN